jgi:hypothetical protein
MRCSGTPVQSTGAAGVSAVALLDLLMAVAALCATLLQYTAHRSVGPSAITLT